MSPHTLYAGISQCPLSCTGIVNDRERGLIPRSYYWGEPSSQISLLIVSKNPAKAPEWESAIYQKTAPENLSKVHYGIVHEVFTGSKSVFSRYHKNLVTRVAVVLGLEAKASIIFRHAAMTALAKCQSVGARTDKIPSSTISTCAERYLFREIALFKPVYLLALGGEVYDFLVQPQVALRHGLQVGKLWHPSWSNMPGGAAAYAKNELSRLHDEYKECIRKSGRGNGILDDSGFM